MNWYGSEIRMYTLFTFVTILNQYFFIRVFKKPSDHVWVGYAATVLLGVFTHYFFFLNLSAQVVFYFTRRSIFPRESLRRFIITALLVGVAFTPWILYVAKLGEVVSQEPHLTTPTAVNLFSTFSQFLFGFQDDHLNTFFLSLWPITIGLGLLTLRRTRIAPETEYFLSTILISIGVAFIVSFIQPIFVSRYMIFTIPSLYLLLSSIFSVYPERIAIWARALLVGVMAFSLILEITNPSSPVKEDYRGAVAYLTNNAKPQDVVVVSAPFTIYPVEYYYRGAAPLFTLPLWDRYAYGPIPAFSSTTMPQEVTRDNKRTSRSMAPPKLRPRVREKY
jgi:mannosyltransferase